MKLNGVMRQHAEHYFQSIGLSSADALENLQSRDMNYGIIDKNYSHFAILLMLKSYEAQQNILLDFHLCKTIIFSRPLSTPG